MTGRESFCDQFACFGKSISCVVVELFRVHAPPIIREWTRSYGTGLIFSTVFPSSLAFIALTNPALSLVYNYFLFNLRYSPHLPILLLHSSSLIPQQLTSPHSAVVGSLMINTSFIANINAVIDRLSLHYYRTPFAFCASYQTSKCKILLTMPAWINSNVMTSFLIVLLPISMVGLESYNRSTLWRHWQRTI